MMGVDDVRARLDPDEGGEQTWRKWMGRVTAQPARGAQRSDTQTTGFALGSRVPAKGQQLAVDVRGQRAGQLERVGLAAAE